MVIAVIGLPPVVASRGDYLVSGCSLLIAVASVIVEHGLGFPEVCGIFVPGPGIKTMSPA